MSLSDKMSTHSSFFLEKVLSTKKIFGHLENLMDICNVSEIKKLIKHSNMSELEKKEEGIKVKRKPYNIQEKKQKDAAYRSLIRLELADELYDKIITIIVLQKKYRDANYSAKHLAAELGTNTRYLSAVINSRFGMNYSCLVNEYRVKDAAFFMTDRRYANLTIEEISTLVGFANRQSFYAAFYKYMNETPNNFRKRHEISNEQFKAQKNSKNANGETSKRGRKRKNASEQ